MQRKSFCCSTLMDTGWCLHQKNTSDSWDILWYNTRKRCITSMRLNVITYTSGLLTSWLFPSISFLTLCSSQSIWDCMLFSTCLVSLGSESASCSWTAVALQRKIKRNRFEAPRLLFKSISGQWSYKFYICFKNTAQYITTFKDRNSTWCLCMFKVLTQWRFLIIHQEKAFKYPRLLFSI